MLLRRPGLVLGLLAPAFFAAAPSCSGTGGDAPGSNFAPFRSGWEVVGNFEFPYLNMDGEVQISSILVGGKEYDDNFANRGDVVVKMNGPEGMILVEMRKFTFAESDEKAQNDFDRLEPWIWSANPTSPKQPSEITDETADCINAGWQEGCGIRVWYNGQIQPQRLGADIRVTLPASYRHGVTIITQDNIVEDAYQDRGSVCVENVNANLDVKLASGEAFVIGAPELTPGPGCSPAEITACEEYMKDGMPAAWAPECPCQEFGHIVVESQDAGSANITVDVPPTLWASMNLENKAMDPAACTATLAGLPDAVIDDTTTDKPHQVRGEINHPSDDAIAGGGYNVRTSSEGCSPVRFAESPEDYPGELNEDEQESEDRGNLVVCGDGCLRASTCEDLLPATR
jgi:hypothetical protein